MKNITLEELIKQASEINLVKSVIPEIKMEVKSFKDLLEKIYHFADKSGYRDGYDKGYYNCHDDAFKDGYNKGYLEGYNECYKDKNKRHAYGINHEQNFRESYRFRLEQQKL